MEMSRKADPSSGTAGGAEPAEAPGALKSASSPLPRRRADFSGGMRYSCWNFGHQFFRDLHVSFGAHRADIIEDNRPAETWRLCQSHVTGNNRFENGVTEIFPGICS